MTDKKLTDEDVVEGLERCISTTTAKACAGCPFNKQNLCDKDQWALERYALDLIKRQKAEIEKLNIQLQGVWNMASLYKAESERWESYNENLLTANTSLSNEILASKTKAYKKFAKRLCEDRLQNDPVVIAAQVELKEMVGEEE